MTFRIKMALVSLFVLLAAACSQDQAPQGHHLRLVAADEPGVSWVTEKDVKSAEWKDTAVGQPVLRLHLKPDAAERMLRLSGSNIGKTVRFTWDGKVISEMRVASAFGSTFELPAPPK